ncbi:hypothetical protein H634G_10498 [Metarhizium anisopliae BRIP 53293]|uniref:FAS1 domain-containing protein n=1 Tax=Metarhizium anisopliae BRIP 53293 TaxID=1291518 RepID=A0A0D9NJA5_METAN|nr:hypothetical protein H634G_10498 [Metarhizium anisopliae BRIP 53293]KJK86407.1 hypothetical protein H633G_09748 [Metarhizium anisopliae BRIP 53284]
MKPLVAGLISAAAASAAFNPLAQQQQPIMPGGDRLPAQPDNKSYAQETPPPPAIKFKTGSSPPPPPPKDQDAHENKYEPQAQPQVSLSDTIGPLRSISSFSSFTRLCESTSSLLADPSARTTVLAPLNSAVDSLPRKPWESPADYRALGSQAYDGTGGQDRANKNLLRFVEAHLVAKSPWPRGEKAKTLAGREIWWEEESDGQRVLMPDRVAVDRVASRVSNGELWIIRGVINYA